MTKRPPLFAAFLFTLALSVAGPALAAEEPAAPAPAADVAAPAAAAAPAPWSIPEEEKTNPVPYLISVYVIVLESILLLLITTNQRLRSAKRKVEALHG
jgi:hypothetical protein